MNPNNMPLSSPEDKIRAELADLHREYQTRAAPLVAMLARFEALKPPAPLIVSREQASEMGFNVPGTATPVAPFDEDSLREHLARVFAALPVTERLRGDEIAGMIRAGMMEKRS